MTDRIRGWLWDEQRQLLAEKEAIKIGYHLSEALYFTTNLSCSFRQVYASVASHLTQRLENIPTRVRGRPYSSSLLKQVIPL